MRKPTLALLAALILVCFAMPSLAQAAPSGAAKTADEAVQPTPAAAPSAAAVDGFAFARVLAATSACSSTSAGTIAAAISPLPAPAIFCPHCPPGWTYCNPFCRCCKGGGT